VKSGPKSLSLFCVLDEAHNLSFESDAPMDKLIREARKFGLGLILASQQAEDFSDTAYANTASKLIFQTLDEKRRVSRKVASKCKNYKDPLLLSDLVAKLPRGQAFFVTRNYGFSVKITPLSKRQIVTSAH
jgi:DNA phosphorothioation-dependent restriction protein DptH